MGLACCTPNYPFEGSKEEEEIVRFFMTGMGSAGKSTVIRQLMKLCSDRPNSYKMYDGEWNEKQTVHNEADRRKWKVIIQGNILEAFCKIIKQCRKFEMTFNSNQSRIAEELEKLCGDIKTLHLRKSEWKSAFCEEFGRKLTSLIADDKDPVRCALRRRHEFCVECRLCDGAEHFLTPEKIQEYSREETLPNEEDIVFARDPTSGLSYYHFKVHKLRIQIHDMGGQKIERKKVLEYLTRWISDSKPNYRNFILYVTSMADYNIVHPDNPQYTLLDESAAFMKMILNLSQVQECGFLIFFNKYDIFQQKLKDVNLRQDFRKYLSNFAKVEDLKKYEQGSLVKPEVLRKAIAAKFADAVKNIVVKRRAPVYHKFTCAVDSKMMETLFGTIRTEIINRKIDSQDWIFF